LSAVARYRSFDREDLRRPDDDGSNSMVALEV
jgi:hypothetical protein